MLTQKEILIPKASRNETSSDLFRASATRSLRTREDQPGNGNENENENENENRRRRNYNNKTSTSSSEWLDLTSSDGITLDQSDTSDSIRTIINISNALTLPSIFANTNWYTDASSIDALTEWTNHQVPALLEALSVTLDSLSSHLFTSSNSNNNMNEMDPLDEALQRAILSAIVAASRFLPPLELSLIHLPTFDSILTNQESRSSKGKETENDLVSETSKNGLDPWMTRQNRKAAKAVLSHSIISGSSVKKGDSDLKFNDCDLAINLLSNHIKPLFSSQLSHSSKLNSETSRPLHLDPNLIKPVGSMGSHSLPSEDVIWKGGGLDAEGNQFLKIVTKETIINSLKNSEIGKSIQIETCSFSQKVEERNQALGCWNVLAWCINSISGAQINTFSSSSKNSSEEKPWESNFHLILPPLLALMDDSNPQFRFIGTTILGRCVLRSFEEQEQDQKDLNSKSLEKLGSIPSNLLQKIGVSTLFLESLKSSLTFSNDERNGIGSRLLDSSLRASRSLIFLTTFCSNSNSNSSLSSDDDEKISTFDSLENDGGLKQSFQFHELVVEGILKVWSYLPSIQMSTNSKSPFNQSHHEILRITFHWLSILSNDLGRFSVRFSNLVIEFLTSQLDLGFDDLEDELSLSNSNNEEKDRKKRKSEKIFWKNLNEKIITSLAANDCLKQLFNSMLSNFENRNDSNSSFDSFDKNDLKVNINGDVKINKIDVSIPPGIEHWSETIIVSCARCWVQLKDLQDSKYEKEVEISLQHRKLLENGLREILLRLEQTKSSKAKEYCSRLLSLDPEVFKPLLPPTSNVL